MNLYKEAREIAQEAWEESEGDLYTAMVYIHESCDGHECSIYYAKALQFCADWDTSDGEEYLEDCGGIAQKGDSFGQIACRIAFATLLVKAQEALHEITEESE
ncbi:MAG: hypothetical protein HRU18_06575 [Pseudoalteromonas sp.]|uniref:hypothetical protein n=1 Tax=Pseudoalteromonas sp. TaxID=53249 RepID=UPI001D76EF6B|nr:hypothetical protein [Pseudoalteromonas sp.]NRA77854.1 hypothetical protein [Pseudoalteromonas sp.]